MAITYTELAETLQDLEAQFRKQVQHESGLPDLCKPLLEPRKNNKYHQRLFYALDTTTFNNTDERLPVVVAVGSNYGQGAAALSGLINNRNNGGPAIEEGLGAYRNHLEVTLDALRNRKVVQDDDHFNLGHTKEVWSMRENNIKIYTNANFREDQLYKGNSSGADWSHLPKAGKYHLVMTNFCPFITRKEWSDHTKPNYPVLEMLLDYGVRLNHITALKKQLKNNICMWGGHGNYDVYYRFFTYLVRGQANGFGSINKSEWLFTSNLSRSPKGHTVCK